MEVQAHMHHLTKEQTHWIPTPGDMDAQSRHPENEGDRERGGRGRGRG